MVSYLWVRVQPPKDQTTLEGFVVVALRLAALPATSSRPTPRRCGACPCTEIQADWGAQRIKDLSLFARGVGGDQAEAVRQRADKSKQVTSLIEEFNYPKYGPGHDVGALRRARHRAAAPRSIMRLAWSPKIEHADGRAVAVTAETDGVPDRVRVHRT